MIQKNLRNEFRKILSKIKNWLLAKIVLQAHLCSGINVKIESYADWAIYNDIFVDGEYDLAIKKVINATHTERHLNVLDIGANVGFFTLRVADLVLRSEKPQTSFEVVLVEGSPKVYHTLKSRLSAEPLLNNKFKIINGLVGQRQGKGKVFESDFHVTNTILLNHLSKGVDVPYIDLMEIYQGNYEIDLLKCDIEGAELIFIENYQELLRKVKYAIFEFHHSLCDTDKCFNILRELGFVNHQRLREVYQGSLDFFWK